MNEIIIKNGDIIDGTGKQRIKSDLYINNGVISEIKQKINKSVDRVIDAKGKIVCPGFLDMHSHTDFTIWGNQRAESSIRQGVTTLYFTPDGWSPAPVYEEHREDLKDYYQSLTFGFPLPFNWTTYDDYFQKLEEKGIGINVRANVGFGTIRINAMGFENRKPTAKEMNDMKKQIINAFKDGVCGFSTGLTYHPQSYSQTEELIELCKVVVKQDGIYHTHTRGGTQGILEALQIGEKTGIPVQLTHTTPSKEQYEIIENAVKKGIDIMFDAYPYTAGSSFLSGSYFPGWIFEGGTQKMLERIRKPEIRDKLRENFREISPTRWPNTKVNTPLIAWCENKNLRKYEGKTVNEISEMLDLDLVDTLCYLIHENKNNVMRVGLNSRSHENVYNAIVHPLMLVGSDGWSLEADSVSQVGFPHPRCYGTFPKILGLHVRVLGRLSLEEAIRKMTSGSAKRMKIKDRGTLEEGKVADVTIFDPKTIIDNATYWNPHRYPSGVEYVLVNGILAIDESKSTGALPGKVLRHETPVSYD